VSLWQILHFWCALPDATTVSRNTKPRAGYGVLLIYRVSKNKHCNSKCLWFCVMLPEKIKVKQARCGPERSRRFRLPDFRDIRHMKVVRLSASWTGRLYPQETLLVFIFTRGWVDPQGHGTVGRNVSLKNPVTPPGIDPGTIRLVAQRLNHYATPGPM
jgi:hypothetical protein